LEKEVEVEEVIVKTDHNIPAIALSAVRLSW
jgi:hypothetical protein